MPATKQIQHIFYTELKSKKYVQKYNKCKKAAMKKSLPQFFLETGNAKNAFAYFPCFVGRAQFIRLIELKG